MAGVHLTTPPGYFFQFPPANDPVALAPPHRQWSVAHPFSIDPTIYNDLLSVQWPLTIAAVYMTTVSLINGVNRRRKNRPWQISRTRPFFWFVIAHNVFLAIYSAWTTIGMAAAIKSSLPAMQTNTDLAHVADALCKLSGPRGIGSAVTFNAANMTWATSSRTVQLLHGTPDSEDVGRLWNEGLSYYGWLFYLSKFYEVVDTMIILAKGKRSSSLQTYHHAGAMICMWAGIRYMSPPIWMFVQINSFIHTVMYSYYTISALGFRVPLAFKRTLTTMQIIQLVVGASYAMGHLFVSYDVPVETPRRFVQNVATALPYITSTIASAAVSADAGSWMKKLALRAIGEEGLAANVPNSLGEPFGAAASAVQEAIQHTREEVRWQWEKATVPCIDTSGQAFAILLNVVYLLPLTALFVRFFVRSYIRRSGASTSKLRRSSVDAVKQVEREVIEALSVEAKQGSYSDFENVSGRLTPLKPLKKAQDQSNVVTTNGKAGNGSAVATNTTPVDKPSDTVLDGIVSKLTDLEPPNSDTIAHKAPASDAASIEPSVSGTGTPHAIATDTTAATSIEETSSTSNEVESSSQKLDRVINDDVVSLADSREGSASPGGEQGNGKAKGKKKGKKPKSGVARDSDTSEVSRQPASSAEAVLGETHKDTPVRDAEAKFRAEKEAADAAARAEEKAEAEAAQHEAEERDRAEEEARAEEATRQAEAKRFAEEEEARQKAAQEEETRRKAEEAEAERKAAEEAARRQAEEEETQRKAAEQAKRKAEEEEAKRQAAEEAKRKAEKEEAEHKAKAEAKRKAEEEARLKAQEEEAKRKAAEEAERKAKGEARRKAEEEEAERKAAEEAKRKAEKEEAERRAAEEAKRKAEEDAKRKAKEEETKRKAAEEAKRKAEEAAQRKAAEEAEAKRKADEEAKRKAEEDIRKKAEEEEAKRKAEEETRRKAEAAEAKRLAEEAEAKRKAEEEAKRKAEEEEATRKAEEEAKRKADEEEATRKAEEEAKLKAEEEAKRKAEEEAKHKAEEEARRKAEEAEAQRLAEEAEAKRKAEEEEAKRKAEEEAKRKAEEEAKRKAEEEATRKAEEEAKRKAEEKAKRKAEEEETKRKAAEEAKRQAEEEAKQKAEEEEAKRKAEEAEAQRLAEEAEANRLAEDAAAKRKAEEEEARRKAEELETARQAEEEARRQAEEEEAKRKAEEEESARQKARKEEEEAEAQRKAEDEEAKHKAGKPEAETNEEEPTAPEKAESLSNGKAVTNGHAEVTTDETNVLHREETIVDNKSSVDEAVRRAYEAAAAAEKDNEADSIISVETTQTINSVVEEAQSYEVTVDDVTSVEEKHAEAEMQP